jgi:hypothetical protein
MRVLKEMAFPSSSAITALIPDYLRKAAAALQGENETRKTALQVKRERAAA